MDKHSEDACVFESRQENPPYGQSVAWCRTHLCVHDSPASRRDGEFGTSPLEKENVPNFAAYIFEIMADKDASRRAESPEGLSQRDDEIRRPDSGSIRARTDTTSLPASVREVFDLVIESQRRCEALRAGLVTGAVPWGDALPEYAKATAPLAKAARLVEDAARA